MVYRWLVCGGVLLSMAGCVTAPYRYCGDLRTEQDACLQPGEPQVERGRRAPVLDTVGWVVGVPAKIIMLDHRVANHNVSAEVETTLQQYLTSNGLDRVKVRVNQYDPAGEWKRLTQNKSVAWPVRYTAGTFTVVGYTLLPGRVFGGDGYNPFTNTVNLYSDVPMLALYEGGRAKDYAQREYKGLYALAYAVPGVGLVWHDARASSDAISYLEQNGTPEQVKEGFRTVCPAYAIDASHPLGSIVGVPLVLPAAAAGHVVAQVKASAIAEARPQPAMAAEVQATAYQAPAPPITDGAAGSAPLQRSGELGNAPPR